MKQGDVRLVYNITTGVYRLVVKQSPLETSPPLVMVELSEEEVVEILMNHFGLEIQNKVQVYDRNKGTVVSG